MMCSVNQNRDRYGFTLLELVLAIFIFGIVVSAVYGGYNLTFSTIENSEKELELASRARVILERMSSDLRSVYPGAGGYLQSSSDGQFDGDTFSCISTAHLLFDPTGFQAGLTTLSYSVKEDEEGGQLELYRSDIPILPGVSSSADDEVLLGYGLESIELKYVDGDGTEHDQWPPGGGFDDLLPVMVRIILQFEGSEEDDGRIFQTAVALPVSQGGEP